MAEVGFTASLLGAGAQALFCRLAAPRRAGASTGRMTCSERTFVLWQGGTNEATRNARPCVRPEEPARRGPDQPAEAHRAIGRPKVPGRFPVPLARARRSWHN